METFGNNIDYWANQSNKNDALCVLDMFEVPENSDIALDFERRINCILEGSHEEELQLKDDIEKHELEIASKNSNSIKLLALMNQVDSVIH